MDKHRSGDHRHGKGPGSDDDDGVFNGIGHDKLGLPSSIDQFISLVDAVLVHPKHGLVAAGRDGATDSASNLFWLYGANGDFHVRAEAGFLTTQSGNGGFSLDVRRDGSWSLSFDGSGKVIGHDKDDGQTAPPPPADDLIRVDILDTGAADYDGSTTPPERINGGLGWDTFQGGVGDYMIGGSGTAGGGLALKGNCAVYTSSPGSVLVDMQNGFGYGANAEGNVYVNMNQVRGSFSPNVLIGNTAGTDLKSGGDNSLMISTGGMGFEMRPDGSGNVLVSTAGGDRLVFDPTHGWALGDDNIMLGFSAKHGNSLDLTFLTGGAAIKMLNGPSVVSNFHSPSAAGFDPATGTGDIDNYLKIVDQADGSHVLFSATGQVQTAGTELIDLKSTHGLNVDALYASGQILT